MGTTIFLNIGIMLWEVNESTSCRHEAPENMTECISVGFSIANFIFMAIYIVETALRIYVHRIAFFQSGANIIDFCVVVLGVIDCLMQFVPHLQEQRTMMRMLLCWSVIAVDFMTPFIVDVDFGDDSEYCH